MDGRHLIPSSILISKETRHFMFPDGMQHEVQISMYQTFLPKIKLRSEQVSRSTYQYRKQKGQRNILNETTGLQSAKSRMQKILQDKWPVSSTNKLQGKIVKEHLQIKREMRYVTKSNVWTLDLDLNQGTEKKNLKQSGKCLVILKNSY